MANDPEKDLVAYLNGKTGAVSGVLLTSGSNLFTGPERPNKVGVPSTAVFVRMYGGPPAMPYFNNSPSGDDRQSSVQVLVRGNPNDYDGAHKLARDVFALVQRAAIAGYIYVLARQSEPIYIAQNDQGLHQFSLNFIMRWIG